MLKYQVELRVSIKLFWNSIIPIWKKLHILENGLKISLYYISSKENILLVHKEEYFNFIENQFKDKDESIKEQFFYGDTYTNRNTANVARKCV